MVHVLHNLSEVLITIREFVLNFLDNLLLSFEKLEYHFWIVGMAVEVITEAVQHHVYFLYVKDILTRE